MPENYNDAKSVRTVTLHNWGQVTCIKAFHSASPLQHGSTSLDAACLCIYIVCLPHRPHMLRMPVYLYGYVSVSICFSACLLVCMSASLSLCFGRVDF
eukprot:5061970-Alexandrium_andersonii.AAC.1